MKVIIINVEIVNAILFMDLHVCVNVFVHVCICALTCLSVFGIRCVDVYVRMRARTDVSYLLIQKYYSDMINLFT